MDIIQIYVHTRYNYGEDWYKCTVAILSANRRIVANV